MARESPAVGRVGAPSVKEHAALRALPNSFPWMSARARRSTSHLLAFGRGARGKSKGSRTCLSTSCDRLLP
eukprot:5919731-Pyramimonas_sp.AAC.1